MHRLITLALTFGLAAILGASLSAPAAAHSSKTSVIIVHERPGAWYWHAPGGKGRWYATPRLGRHHDFHQWRILRAQPRFDRFRFRFHDRHYDRPRWHRDHRRPDRHWRHERHRDHDRGRHGHRHHR